MKLFFLLITSITLSVNLVGCTNTNVKEDAPNQRQNALDQLSLHEKSEKLGGPAITGVDVSDPELDRNDNRNKKNNLLVVRKNHQKYVGNDQIRLRNADDAAKAVSDLPGVKDATILVTDNNAFVSSKMEGKNRLTSELRIKISRKVKSIEDDIDRVHISDNNNFYNRMNFYKDELNRGKPVSSIANEFSDTVRRVFPDAR